MVPYRLQSTFAHEVGEEGRSKTEPGEKGLEEQFEFNMVTVLLNRGADSAAGAGRARNGPRLSSKPSREK